VLPKRFYAEADMPAEGDGFVLRLDGKVAMTPARNVLRAPTRRLAHAIALEWRSQGERILPATMPVTRLAGSAIDGVAGRMDDVRRDILGYGDTDLLYYRASGPEGLVERQRAAWDPPLAWAERRFGLRFILVEGVVHLPQPAPVRAALAGVVGDYNDPFRLTGLSLATTLTGSLLLALALAEGVLDADAAWRASLVDEDWNIGQWGEDAEAAQRRAGRRLDFDAAALALLPDCVGE
jgi:chaperone required for assembly of F1-ATPase